MKSSMRPTRTLLTALVLAAACGGAPAVSSTTASSSTLTVEQARAIALTQVPGTIVEEEYEQERAGWVYGFEIRPTAGGGIKEVEIDAATGKVLEIEDGDDDDGGDDGDGDDDDDDDDD